MKRSMVKSKILEAILDLFVIEEARDACYLFDNLHEIVQEEFWGKCNLIQTGSFAEGMTNYNDVDKMHILDDLIVVASENEIPINYTDGVLILDASDCSPGFVKLKLLRDIKENTFDIYTKYKGNLYLDSLKFLSVKFTRKDLMNNVDAHGPAVMTTGESDQHDVDLVECFKCLSWPSSAHKMIAKNKSNTNENHNITRDGCHVVAVAHHQSKTPELEFRLSFSLAEKLLIKDWNNKQFQVYYITKLLFKKYFSEDSFLTKGLCSYFAKTIIFGLDEMYPRTYWQDKTLLFLVHQLFAVLKRYLEEKSMPNYFVPKYLMLSSFTDRQLEDLLQRLHEVSSDIFSSILCSLEEYDESLEILISVYTNCQSIGQNHVTENILLSISEEDFLDEKDISFVPYGGRKAWHCYKLTHLYIDVFYRFFSHHFNVSIPLHRSRGIQNSKRRLKTLTDNSNLLRAADIILNRCLGCIALSALFSLSVEKRQHNLVLWTEIESLFASSIHFPSQLNDGGVVGSIYLALFYYVTGQLNKSKDILLVTVKTALNQIKQGMWHRLQSLICISTEKNRLLNCPRFFASEETLRELFEKLHLHVCVEFDPLVLCTYLLCMIQGKELHFLFETACGKHMLTTRTNKEADYLKYKLGLLEPDSDKFMELSREIQCETCEYVEYIKKNAPPLNLPQ